METTFADLAKRAVRYGIAYGPAMKEPTLVGVGCCCTGDEIALHTWSAANDTAKHNPMLLPRIDDTIDDGPNTPMILATYDVSETQAIVIVGLWEYESAIRSLWNKIRKFHNSKGRILFVRGAIVDR